MAEKMAKGETGKWVFKVRVDTGYNALESAFNAEKQKIKDKYKTQNNWQAYTSSPPQALLQLHKELEIQNNNEEQRLLEDLEKRFTSEYEAYLPTALGYSPPDAEKVAKQDKDAVVQDIFYREIASNFHRPYEFAEFPLTVRFVNETGIRIQTSNKSFWKPATSIRTTVLGCDEYQIENNLCSDTKN